MPLLAWFACLLALVATPAIAASTLDHGRIDAASLRGNAAGLPSARGVTVYLPDGYAANRAKRFPVVYYLGNFFEDDRAPWANNGAQALFDRAIARGVIGDYRAGDGQRHKDILRFGFTPLYLGFEDVWNSVEQLVQVLETGEWRRPEFNRKNAVT